MSFDGRSKDSIIATLIKQRRALLDKLLERTPSRYAGIDERIARKETWEEVRKIEAQIDALVAA